ncbi:hypothetical protein [Lichenibacterium dinghuense]|nr:hypothetical protein [Lichenibacterium sp. 6Y81]
MLYSFSDVELDRTVLAAPIDLDVVDRFLHDPDCFRVLPGRQG